MDVKYIGLIIIAITLIIIIIILTTTTIVFSLRKEKFKAFSGKLISIKSAHNKYLSSKTLKCDSDKVTNDEKFMVKKINDTTFALKSPVTGMYFYSDKDGNIITAGANLKRVRFEIVKKDATHFAFKNSRNKYLSCQTDGTLQWNRDSAQGWEIFECNECK